MPWLTVGTFSTTMHFQRLRTVWPVDMRDYECGDHSDIAAGGVGVRAEVQTSKLNFDPPPYNGEWNDKLLTGPADGGNLCAKFESAGGGRENFAERCPSQRCVLTGQNGTDDGFLEA